MAMHKTMKQYTIGLVLAAGLSVGLTLSGCSDFDEINRSQYEAGTDLVQIEYFINNSIISAQMNPEVAERAFVLYWKDAAHTDRIGSLSEYYTDDGWTGNYFGYVTTWLSYINEAIALYQAKEAEGSLQPYSKNLYEVARIWRVYLMSEFADNFGPMPLNGFQGEEVQFNTVEEVYNFLLQELEESTKDLALSPAAPEATTKLDPAYGYDFAKWRKYGNSLRMRLAMRVVNADPELARKHFEAAVSEGYISSLDEIFSVQERPGWDDLTGVMTREWNSQYLSATLNNLYTGLGGITSEEQIGAYVRSAVKILNDAAGADSPQPIRVKFNAPDWMGVRWSDHFPTTTNDPSAGFWNDGLNNTMDPRAYVAYGIPGDLNNPHFCKYPSWSSAASVTRRALEKKVEGSSKPDTVAVINSAFTWNAPVAGDWGDKGALNKVAFFRGNTPTLVLDFRNSSMRRVFYGPWESYFLIAEAAVRGWQVPMSGKEAYERGIRESFGYFDQCFPDAGISKYLDQYLASESYNRVGTSVAWDHTAEPQPVTKHYLNGLTGKEESYEYHYPSNGLYKDGTVSNDHLTKIITQKYIAQVPWLPLEAWSDQRRLGLPFFENPMVEKTITNLPALTKENYKESRWEFFPQRLPFPTSLKNNSPKDYADALSKLGSPDEIGTPLWWAAYRK